MHILQNGVISVKIKMQIHSAFSYLFTIMCVNIHKTEPTVDGNDDERESHYSDCM